MKFSQKVVMSCFLLFWFSLSVVDLYGNLFISHFKHPTIWRAWEVVSNYYGKDLDHVPFKPLSSYDGRLVGDLLNPFNFKPLPNEVRHQVFTIDEYGYRNSPHFMDTPLDAVIIGSSFVGGAAFSQEDLVSSILTEKYGIRTYNYVSSVQTFWQSQEFLKNQPKFVIVLGTEGETYSSGWRYNIYDNNLAPSRHAWDSYEEWHKNNEHRFDNFRSVADDFMYYSLVRMYTNNLYREVVNFGRNRAQISAYPTQRYVTYDTSTGTLYYQADYDNPLLGSEGKKESDALKAVQTLNDTAEKLKQRGIILIMVSMPSKTHAEMPKYKFIPDQTRALVYFNQLAEKQGQFRNIDMFKLTKKIIQNPDEHLYFQDDSHWNVTSNQLISTELAKEICPALSAQHICHEALTKDP